MSELKMPRKGQSAVMLQDLNAEHAASPISASVEAPAGHSRPQPEDVSVAVEGKEGQPAGSTSRKATTRRAGKQVGKIASRQEANKPSHQDSLPTALQESNITNLQTRQKPNGHGALDSVVAVPAPPQDSQHAQPPREQRLTAALGIAQHDDTTVVSVRLSVRLNAYMDDYVARVNRMDPKRKYRKQDAVAEAFAAFYADHPMPVLPSDDL